MSDPQRNDEEVAAELLDVLRADEREAPEELPEQTIKKVQALITTRDLIDLTTVVFLLRFCAPLIDLIAAMLGHDGTHSAAQNEPRARRGASPPDTAQTRRDEDE